MNAIRTHRLSCGATIVLEPMTDVRSVGLTWLLPAGTATEPDDRQGLASILSEMLFRGAGERSSRSHSDALDMLGISRSGSARTRHLALGVTMLGARLLDGLPLIADMVRQPKLEQEAFEPVRDLCLQSLAGLDDEPQEKTMVLLKERHMAPPYNRSGYGKQADLEDAVLDDVQAMWRSRFRPEQSIIGIAGDLDPDALVEQVEELLTDWEGAAPEPKSDATTERGAHHVTDESAQVHIGVMHDAPKETDPASMLERVATAALGGGMSSRLFTEVREKRSLCYAVHAAYGAGRDDGRVLCYAGTTPERAQETLDVLFGEIERMRDGIDEDEFQRAVTGLKSRIVMHGESTSARAAAIASDMFVRGGARSLDELANEVDAVTRQAVNEYLAQRELGMPTIVTIGPQALRSPA
ncbi:MAG: insulinase family protein [Phycisphaerales bacterium]|nr:insulinase family protein [Phycisphaerales bacterium]